MIARSVFPSPIPRKRRIEVVDADPVSLPNSQEQQETNIRGRESSLHLFIYTYIYSLYIDIAFGAYMGLHMV